MKKTIIYIFAGLFILFSGIVIGKKSIKNDHIKEFENMRHLSLASEINLQLNLLKLMTNDKSSDANKMLLKWVEQNICEMGAYKKSNFFTPNKEITAIIIKTKNFVEEKKLSVGECSKTTFTEYSDQGR